MDAVQDDPVKSEPEIICAVAVVLDENMISPAENCPPDKYVTIRVGESADVASSVATTLAKIVDVLSVII